MTARPRLILYGCVLIASISGALALWLLVAGVEITVTSAGTTESRRGPQLSALIPLFFSGQTIFGVARREQHHLWIGAIGTTLYGALFVFSAGPYHLTLGLLLLALVALASRHEGTDTSPTD